MSEGCVGVSLEDFGISTPEFIVVNQGDFRQDRSTKGNECGIDNQYFFTDVDNVFISFNENAVSVGIAPLEVDSRMSSH